MTIDEAIKTIATSEAFEDFSYVFDDWNDADQSISRVKALPAIVHILPISGTMTVRNGRIYDSEQVAITFMDKVVRDASGDDQREVFERMKEAAMTFIALANESGHFEKVSVVSYGILYNQLASIVTGVTLKLEITDLGQCLSTTLTSEE